MAPSPIPAPLPPWARALLQVAPWIPGGLQEALEYIGNLFDATDPQPSAWMHIQAVGAPVGSTERADDFVTTFDIVNITGGQVDSSWTASDTSTVNGALGQLLIAWAAVMSDEYTWKELRFYKRFFNDLSVEEPYAKSGPPQIVYPWAIAGAATTQQAPQVAITSTDRTTYPRHWGRNYWPHPHPSNTAGTGYIASASVDAIANMVHTAYATLMAAEFFPVVPVTQIDNARARGLLTVTSVQVDNLYDVIRRRRPEKATYRKVLAV